MRPAPAGLINGRPRHLARAPSQSWESVTQSGTRTYTQVGGEDSRDICQSYLWHYGRMQFVVVNKSLHTKFCLWPKMSKIIRAGERGWGQRFISHVRGMRIPSGDGTKRRRRGSKYQKLCAKSSRRNGLKPNGVNP